MIRKYFQFEENQTNYRQETIGGITTFLTMAYIIIVNPKILEAAGIPFGPSMVATILTAFFGTLIMGIYAKRPFAIAPYMGENAFIAYTVVQVLGYSWQTALGAIFISGIIHIPIQHPPQTMQMVRHQTYCIRLKRVILGDLFPNRPQAFTCKRNSQGSWLF